MNKCETIEARKLTALYMERKNNWSGGHISIILSVCLTVHLSVYTPCQEQG